MCYSIESLNYKRIILYLMVSAYTVKYYLSTNDFISSSDTLLKTATRSSIGWRWWGRRWRTSCSFHLHLWRWHLLLLLRNVFRDRYRRRYISFFHSRRRRETFVHSHRSRRRFWRSSLAHCLWWLILWLHLRFNLRSLVGLYLWDLFDLCFGRLLTLRILLLNVACYLLDLLIVGTLRTNAWHDLFLFLDLRIIDINLFRFIFMDKGAVKVLELLVDGGFISGTPIL